MLVKSNGILGKIKVGDKIRYYKAFGNESNETEVAIVHSINPCNNKTENQYYENCNVCVGMIGIEKYPCECFGYNRKYTTIVEIIKCDFIEENEFKI